MTVNTRNWQRLGLRLVAWLPRRRQAVWLTTLYEMHRVFFLGHCEPWLQAHVRTAYDEQRWRRIVPLNFWLRLHGTLYCLRLHRQGHVLPGVRKVLGLSEEGAGAGLPPEAFPQWMRQDLRVLGQIDAQLCPSADFFARFHAWRPHADPSAGELLAAAWRALGQTQYDVVVIAPWVRTGGADKGLIQYCGYYIAHGLKVALLTTYSAESNRLDDIPPEVAVAELGLQWKALRIEEQTWLLARLLLLLRPRCVHNALSELAWRCYAAHGIALRTVGIALAASLYAEDVTAQGCRLGYATDFLPRCRSMLDYLITDSQPWAQRFQSHYALTITRVAGVRFYIPAAMLAPDYSALLQAQSSLASAQPLVLWAGRLCTQKRPDLLLEVVRDMPDVQFEVYGPIEPEAEMSAQALKKLPNVKMGGEYRNFHALVRGKPYAALLYTTSFDGMPNVLLEAAAEQLPIVAPPAIGGLAELVDESSAFCVDDAQNAVSYRDALRQALGNPALAKDKATQAKKRLVEKFSKQAFEKEMDAVMRRLFDTCAQQDVA